MRGFVVIVRMWLYRMSEVMLYVLGYAVCLKLCRMPEVVPYVWGYVVCLKQRRG